jgi:hypothetical protein
MNSTDHQRLYRLLEFRILTPKRRKLVAAHVLEGVSLARGCSMLALNVGRESRREDVTACLAAYRRSGDPEGKDELYEAARRLDILWNGASNSPNLAYEQFANVNLPLTTKGIFITPDGKTVDASGKPVPAPPRPTGLTVKASADWKCPCRPEAMNRAGGYLCVFCGASNPETAANWASWERAQCA